MMSSKPILFLLPAGFEDANAGEGLFYCPFCLRIEGMLAAFPELRSELDTRYVSFAKPRGALADYAGVQTQSCPHLILPEGDDAYSVSASLPAEGKARRIEDTSLIEDYLTERFNLPRRHP